MRTKNRVRLSVVLGSLALLLVALALTGATGGTCLPVEPAVPELQQTDFISACGGFESNLKSAPRLAATDYCAAEVLDWSYEATASMLTLRDERILLNCCGDHAMTAEVVDGVYVVTESDAPEGGTGRCHCMCVFDFGLELQGVPAGTIDLRIVRHVEETGDTVVWEGALDLAAGAGEVVLDTTDLGMWCGAAE